MNGTGPFPFATIPPAVRHTVSLAVVVLVYVGYEKSGTVIDDGGLFLLLSIAVLFSAWFAGTGTALAATIMGAVLGSLSAGQTQAIPVQTHLALFIGQGLLLTALVAELRRSRRVAEREAGEAEGARRDVEAASRMKDEFLGTISHELRTPLNAVLGWMHLIRTGKLDRETEGRGLEAIERNVRLQAQLTADLLDMSKALTGRLNLVMQPVSLNAVVADALAQVSAAATAKNVAIHIDRPEDRPIVVRADTNRLRQIVWHLVANAIKFTPSGGTVDVLVESDTQACVTVRDTGPGIDPTFLPRVFDRFTQADSSTTRRAGGLGVGLSLVRELVERHGGEIKAANRENGRGAVFSVRLPIRAADQKSDAVPPEPELVEAGSPLNGIRVLVLDRDRDARELLSVVLRQRGASVRLSGSVDEALEMLESWRPDVLLSDAMWPDHDVYSLVGKVQSLESDRGGRIPALALTTLARTDEGMRRMLSGVKRDLPKPIEPAVLTAEIARLTGRERRGAQR
jgi:signal transduction histidine kinase/CheY-like chemotaxis protein